MQTESPIKSKELDLSQYSTKQLSPDYRIHWRILKDKNEIEIVAVVNGTSWVGLGWRPRKSTATCRNFPLLQKSGAASGQLVKSSVSQNSKSPSAEPEPEHTTAEPSAEKSPKPEPEKEPAPEGEPASAEPEPKTEPSSEPESSSEPKREPESGNLQNHTRRSEN